MLQRDVYHDEDDGQLGQPPRPCVVDCLLSTTKFVPYIPINLIFKKDLSLMAKLRKRSETMYIYKTLLLTFTNICHGRVIDV